MDYELKERACARVRESRLPLWQPFSAHTRWSFPPRFPDPPPTPLPAFSLARDPPGGAPAFMGTLCGLQIEACF